MRKTALVVLMIWLAAVVKPGEILAAKGKITPTTIPTVTMAPTPTVEVKNNNIAEPNSKDVTYRLESVLEKHPVGKWNGWNTIRKSVQVAVNRGVSANTIVLLLMLPLVATVVSLLHYVVGLSGYGIFMPTMMAVALLATGIPGGLVLFGAILLMTMLSNALLRKLKLHFWPTRAITLIFVSMATFAIMAGSTYFGLIDIRNISIFPILFMILLVEEFVRTQLARSRHEAINLAIGTILLSIFGAVIMETRTIQEWVIINPEWTILVVVVANLLVGNYTGIRWLEIKRFSKAIRSKKNLKSKI